ncbi:ABC transporter substrate-binding protein [Microbacterium sp. NPDC058342]|uniref:ABC transporter substrate-binding protein n=1 Tax=Microbacterium sp. NPDC058342 TaxID=3346454 RepID=UPI003646E61E
MTRHHAHRGDRSRTLHAVSRSTRLIALGATAALLLSACAPTGDAEPSSSGAGAKRGGTIHMLQQSDFSYLDPARGWDTGVAQIYRLLYRGLTTQAAGDSDDPSSVVPDLATDLGTVSDDGLTWTYTLKDGLAFDDGTPITSAEVKFGISRAWDPQIGIGSPYLVKTIAAPDDYQGPYVSGELDAIETPDAKTIVFHLKKPFPEFDAVLAQPNGAPFPVGSGGGEEFLKKVIASGPYTLEEYTPGTRIELKRNPNWQAETDDVRKAYPDEWVFDLGLDPATIDERLIADQGADVNSIASGITKASLPRLTDPKLKKRLLSAEGVCTSYMSMNTAEGPFADVRLRQAVNWALDREMIVNAIGGPQMTKAVTTIVPASINGHLDYDLYPGPDADKAKQLLAEADHPDGFTFTLDIASADATKDRAIAIQESLSKVGIDVELNVIDTSIFYETVQTPANAHDAALASWCPDWSSSASTFIPPLFSSSAITEKGNQNLAQFSDPAIDRRIEEVAAMTDIAEANKAWGELDKLIMEKAPWAPLTVGKGLFLPGSNVANFTPSTDLLDLSVMGLKDPQKGN